MVIYVSPKDENGEAPVYGPLLKEILTSRRNLFLTGRAGTGKTTLLKRLLRDAGDKAVVLAPTGLAAVNAGGQTIHSFFKFPPRMLDKADVKKMRNQRLVKTLETMIIDEISMVRADMMQTISEMLQLNRGNREPFGGVRMILSGDLHQLPPVVESQVEPILQDSFGGPWFFKAPGFQDGQFRLAALKHVFRQEDEKFLAILNGMRNSRLSPEEVATVQSRVSTRTPAEASETHVVLTPNNAAAWRINQQRLEELDGVPTSFECSTDGQFDERSFPTEAVLELKPGARVMLIKNDHQGRWVNGSIGTVEALSDKDAFVSIDGETHRIAPQAWEKYRYEFDSDKKAVNRQVVGSFRQLPLRLAYAVTIHKSQGMTLDNVYIDFDNGMFAHGQAYVAFSRCRSLEGLELSRELRPRDIIIDKTAFQFGKLNVVAESDAFYLADMEGEGFSLTGG